MTEEITPIENVEEEVSLEQFSVNGSLSSFTVRLSGLIVFLALMAVATLFIFDLTTSMDIISDIRITIPLVILMYFVKVLFQYLALLGFAGIGKSQIRLGFSTLNFSPFVHAKRPFELKRFRIYLLLPALCLSIIPLIISIILHNPIVYFCATFAMAFCISDLISFFRSLTMNGNMLAADHPKLYGFVLYENPFSN
ncbi:MAG: hypothetical protein CVU05_03645 [Bacteroidetes bacterium HGW-Bacteroidetes-21]|jgi:hypothetical protein|nr:MAG: hypothetical protein CVU05_03645 [Bacteroidetes bacterium HGW-Bacteroidetes-21]